MRRKCPHCGKNVEIKNVSKEPDSREVVELKCGHKFTEVSRSTHESVSISDTVQASVVKAVQQAKREIGADQKSIRLIERIKREKELDTSNIKNQDQRILDKLITLGMVTSFLDNTVSISPIGERVLKALK